ncbi:unnamed protein product, partial [Laminaria digitata]
TQCAGEGTPPDDDERRHHQHQQQTEGENLSQNGERWEQTAEKGARNGLTVAASGNGDQATAQRAEGKHERRSLSGSQAPPEEENRRRCRSEVHGRMMNDYCGDTSVQDFGRSSRDDKNWDEEEYRSPYLANDGLGGDDGRDGGTDD